MDESSAGVALTESQEGLRLMAYQDSGGVWTIGYGHTGPDVHAGLTITLERAQELLRADLARCVAAVNADVRAPMSQGQFDALCDFVFNEGTGALAVSTTLRLLNAGDVQGAADALLMWDKSKIGGVLQENPVLLRRRKAERALFLAAA